MQSLPVLGVGYSASYREGRRRKKICAESHLNRWEPHTPIYCMATVLWEFRKRQVEGGVYELSQFCSQSSLQPGESSKSLAISRSCKKVQEDLETFALCSQSWGNKFSEAWIPKASISLSTQSFLGWSHVRFLQTKTVSGIRVRVSILWERQVSQLLGSGAPSFNEVVSWPSATLVTASRLGSSSFNRSPGFSDSPTTWVLLLALHPISLDAEGLGP